MLIHYIITFIFSTQIYLSIDNSNVIVMLQKIRIIIIRILIYNARTRFVMAFIKTRKSWFLQQSLQHSLWLQSMLLRKIKSRN
jgi:hypothetical protein